jgi:hypothetical protein
VLLSEVYDKISNLKNKSIDTDEIIKIQETEGDEVEVEESEERTQMIIRLAKNKIEHMDPALKVIEKG